MEKSIAQAWGRLKSLMLKCLIHEFPSNIVINNFYTRLSLQDKDLLDASCSGSFTWKKEEDKWDLLDRIQENTEGWENDKGRESGINYDFETLRRFSTRRRFVVSKCSCYLLWRHSARGRSRTNPYSLRPPSPSNLFRWHTLTTAATDFPPSRRGCSSGTTSTCRSATPSRTNGSWASLVVLSHRSRMH